MEQNNIFYRPVWTCGRYNPEFHTAIYYNNITGLSYFFEDLSADVIGEILKNGRNNDISVEYISKSLSIDMSNVKDFFEVLMNEGLLTDVIVDDDGIARYRQYVRDTKRNQLQEIEKTVEEKLPIDFSTAERMYAEKCGIVSSVMFELTYRCSEKCIHCYNFGATRNDNEESHRADLKELSFEEYKRVIDELYDLGLYKVCFTGGDPFSNRYIWDLIDYVYCKDIAFDIFTNGLNVVDCKRLADYYPRTVGISIYSAIEKDHDYITRIKGSCKKSLSVLEELSDLSVPLVLKCCIMQPNFKSYYTIYDLCKRYHAAPQMEINITDSVEGDKCARILRLTPEQMEVVLRDNNIKLYVGKEAPNYGGLEHRVMNIKPCGAGENSFCLTPDGKLIPCCSFHLEFGDIRKQSVKEIIATSEPMKFWNETTLEKYEECGIHEYCGYCNLCAGINYSEHGNILKAAENNCYTARIRYNLAMRMKNEGYDPLCGKTLHDKINDFADYAQISLKRLI